MNCKPGDLAFLIRGAHGAASPHIGKVVEVLHLTHRATNLGNIWAVRFQCPIDACVINHQTGRVGEVSWTPVLICHCPDSWLRPIRPDDITDTELAALYKPSPIKSPEAA